MRSLLVLTLLLSACQNGKSVDSQTITTETQLDYVWSQVVASGSLKEPALVNAIAIRGVTRGSSCPVGMSVRGKSSENYPVTVCEKIIALKDISRKEVYHIAGHKLHLRPLSEVEHIHVIGDTGCHDGKQSCKSEWPFKELADSLASKRPQLIIHTGDYLYYGARRHEENDYRAEKARDGWSYWKRDFFDPAKKLLPLAPWVFTRGNHEGCPRRDYGYRLFLGQGEFQMECTDVDTSYIVDVSGDSFLMWDTSLANDLEVEVESNGKLASKEIEAIVVRLKKQLNGYRHFVNTSKRQEASNFIVTHRPPWGCRPKSLSECFPGGYLVNKYVLAELRYGASLRGIGYTISGHNHNFSMTSFADRGPMQIIVGNGGTKLMPKTNHMISNLRRKARSSLSLTEYGYVRLKKLSPKRSWLISLHLHEKKDPHLFIIADRNYFPISCADKRPPRGISSKLFKAARSEFCQGVP